MFDYNVGQSHYEVRSKADWDRNKNAEILLVEDWKPGVKRLHVRDVISTPAQFWLVYCRDEFLPKPTVQRYANAHGQIPLQIHND